MQTASQSPLNPAFAREQARPRPMEDVVYKVMTVGAILLVLSTVCIF